MPNPLTLYVPIKQDPTSQQVARGALSLFDQFAAGLDASQIVHTARLVGVPNPPGMDGLQAIILITVYDGAFAPYLQFFWGPETQALFKALMQISSIAPQSDDFAGFEKWTADNNIPLTLYSAYPWTVKQIVDKFK